MHLAVVFEWFLHPMAQMLLVVILFCRKSSKLVFIMHHAQDVHDATDLSPCSGVKNDYTDQAK